MKGNNFYNGHAIFASPNGIVVGSSGLLNVGSLSLLTPSQDKFDDFVSSYGSDSLSGYEFGGDSYKGLITDSHGKIIFNGKVLSRGEVNLYGDEITIEGTDSEKAGLIAGWKDTGATFTNLEAAKNTFNSLVSNNITDTKNFALGADGKVKIVAGFKDYDDSGNPVGTVKKAEVAVKNANVGGSDVEIKANSARDIGLLDITTLADQDDAISSKITIEDSQIVGNNVDVSAVSKATLARNINESVPTIFLWIFNRADAKIEDYFDNGIYDGFEGARSSAVIDIINSTVQSVGSGETDGLSITTSSIASTGINAGGLDSLVGEIVPHIFYGYGTKTESKINIKDSALKAKKDVKLNALSQNLMKAYVLNKGVVSLQATDAFDFATARNSTEADTKITIDSSTVEGLNVSAQAFSYNDLVNRVELTSYIGENDQATYGQGGSGAVMAMLVNDTDIKSAVEVKNNSSITAANDVTLNAFNIDNVSNSVMSLIEDPTGYSKKYEANWKEGLKADFSRLLVDLKTIPLFMNFTFSDFTDKFKTKIDTIGDKHFQNYKGMEEKATFQFGTGFLFNTSKTTNNVIIDHSNINAGRNINLKAHTVDLTTNQSIASAAQDVKVGGAFSLLVNDQTNNNKVDVVNSSALQGGIYSKINIDSIVELPAQQGTFGFSMKLPEIIASTLVKGAEAAEEGIETAVEKIAGAFDYDVDMDWNNVKKDWKGDFTLAFDLNFGAKDTLEFGLHDHNDDATGIGLIPQVGLMGFYNNFALSTGGGDKLGLSGALASNTITNNSDVNITNSTIDARNDTESIQDAKGIYVNSVVSASVHDSIDFFTNVSVLAAPDLINIFNASGAVAVGGSVLIQDFTNNARATIDNSTLNAKGGELEVNSAAEQSYLNLVTPGGKAETVGVIGGVSVQKVKGTTSTTVKNNSKLISDVAGRISKISVNSGKAKVAFSEKNTHIGEDGIKLLDDDGNFNLGKAREVEDHVTTFALDGSFVRQSGTAGGTASSGAALGASVIVKSIDRTVKTDIDNSTLMAWYIDVASNSYNKDILVTLAAAFAGGVSSDKNTQNNANNGNNNQNAENNRPQEMQNVGGWMDIMDDAQPDETKTQTLEEFFADNDANEQGVQNAQGQVNNEDGQEPEQMAGGVANPENARANFSLALAGSVSVLNDKSIVETEITNSTIQPLEKLNVTSSRDNFILNVNGGIASAGNVGGGAAVNVYSDKGSSRAIIQDSTVEYQGYGGFARELNLSSTSNHKIIETAVGVGVASDDESGVKVAVGGSFSTNTLNDKTEALIKNSTIKRLDKLEGDDPDTKYKNEVLEKYSEIIDTNVKASSDNIIWNAGGDIGVSKGNNSSFALGAGVAGNMDLIEQTVTAEVADSTLNNTKDLIITSDANYDINSIGVAGAVVTGAQYSFNIDGALGLEFIENNVTATLKNSSVTAKGDVKTKANSVISGRTLTGGFDISTANTSFGVGIGAVLESDSSKVIAEIANSKILKSKSVEVNANSSDKRQFLAANLGVQTGSSSAAINANGIVSVIKTTVNALVSGTSEITTDGDLKVNSKYDNTNEGVTAVVTKAGKLALGANIIANYYENDVRSEISSATNVKKAGNINVSAETDETIDLIPAAISVASDGVGAVAANVVVNIIKDKTNAIAAGSITSSGNMAVYANGDTLMYNRGGTLAVSGADGLVALAGAVNVDYIEKKVNAQIGNNDKRTKFYVSGDVSTTASSINSLGGTKNSSQGYDRDDITSDSYQDNLMQKDADGNYTGLKTKKTINEKGEEVDVYTNSFENWNMFYNIAAGGQGAVSGAVIVKTIENTVNAQVLNTDLYKLNKLKVLATDYSIKNLIAGQISASSTMAVGVQVVVTDDESKTSALVSNSKIAKKSPSEVATEAESENVSSVVVAAKNQKDNNQILVAGSFSKNASIGANILRNTINDSTVAKIEDSEVISDAVNVNAEEDMNSSRIVVSATVAGQGVALNVSPLINYYGDRSEKQDGETDEAFEARRKGKTIAEISNSTIKKAKIDISSDTNIKTRDIGVGVAGAGQGFAATGLAIKNTYNTITRALISNNSIIDTEKDVALNANSVANSNNWIVGASVVGQGGTIVANVIINNMVSEATARISDSAITNAGNISLNTNKDKKDELKNYGISASAAGMGGAGAANVMYNIYDNTVASEIFNTSIAKSNSISANAYSNRELLNFNYGVSAAGLGGAVLTNAIVNNIRTNSLASINANDKKIKTSGALTVIADDNTYTDNTLGFVSGGAGAAGANINLFYSDNLAKAEVLSDAAGQIEASSANVNSTTTSGMKRVKVGAIGGLVGVAADVELIRLGKAVAWDEINSNETAEQKQLREERELKEAKTANDNVSSIYNTIMGDDKKYYNPTDASKVETGSVARVNGNLKTEYNIDVNAENRLKGVNDSDTLVLDNVSASIGLGSIGVGVKNVKIANNTIAEISGGNVESELGRVSVDAKNTAKVKINSVKVTAAGTNIQGGSEVYSNTSNTVAQIVDSTVEGYGVDVTSNSSSHGKIDATHVVASIEDAVGIDLAETTDNNNTVALISGNTNIDTRTGKLNVHATSDTDLSSEKATVSVALVEGVKVAKNEVNASSVTKALIENVTGEIKASGIEIVSDYNKMSVSSKSNVTSVTGVSLASWKKNTTLMNADFTSGINSPNLSIVNTGATLIETAKGNNLEKITSVSQIKNVDVSLAGFFAGTFVDSENTATSNTYLNVKDHTAKTLAINANLNSVAEAIVGSTKVSLLGVNSIGADAKNTSKLNLDISGTNTIQLGAVIKAENNASVKSDLSSFSFGLGVSGQTVKINSVLDSDTVANIGGNFNFATADFTFKTIRNAVMSKSTGSGGIINASDTSSGNTLKGKSELNLKNMNNDLVKGNFAKIKNIATNTFDLTTADASGGFFDISEDKTTATLTSDAITNVINSDFNSRGNFSLETRNDTIIKDNGSIAGGGFVAIMGNTSNKTYTSNAKLSLENSKINAESLNINVLSDISSAKNGYVEYSGAGGGFSAGVDLSLTNTLNQTSEVELKNSKLLSASDAVLNAKTTSAYKQKADTSAGGFIAIPKAVSTLNSNNTQKISLDSSSTVSAANDVKLNLDSSNTLESRVYSAVKDFAGSPKAESYVKTIINNTLDNSGTISAGNLVDVNFMEDSENNLTVYAHSKAEAGFATTNEGGMLTRTVNNKLNVNSNGTIASAKDVGIHFSSGYGKLSSEVSWETTSYACFGIPIYDHGEDYTKVTMDGTSAFDLSGKVIAGKSSEKYMKINRDGSVDLALTTGFTSDDYKLFSGTQDGAAVKAEKLEIINGKLAELDDEIDFYKRADGAFATELRELDAQIEVVGRRGEHYQLMLGYAKQYPDKYVIYNSKVDTDKGGSDFDLAVLDDFNRLIKNSSGLSFDACDQLIRDYKEYRVAVMGNADVQNPTTNPIPLQNFQEFINTYTGFTLTASQKNAIMTQCNNVAKNMEDYSRFYTQFGTVFYKQVGTGKMFVGMKDPSNPDTQGKFNSCAYLDNDYNQYLQLQDRKTAIQKERETTYNKIRPSVGTLIKQRSALLAERNSIINTPESSFDNPDARYSVVFNDFSSSENSKIEITGISNTDIKGSGTFESGGAQSFKVDNYSTRSLIFDNIDSATASSVSLSINGDDYTGYANSSNAVNAAGTSGVHFKTSNGTGDAGVVINNYFDNTNPLAKTLNIANPTLASDIIFKNTVKSPSDLKIFNDSGSIIFEKLDTSLISGAINLLATKGDVNLTAAENKVLTLGSSSSIFAGNSVNITADEYSISAPITAGYNSALKLIITDSMLSNLVFDPTTGENILINLGQTPWLNAPWDDSGNTNNIKAVYKDGEIYVFDVNKFAGSDSSALNRGRINIASNSQSTIKTDKTEYYSGYQDILISNWTDKTLNVASISNFNSEGGLYINDSRSEVGFSHKEESASTVLKATEGKLVVDGVIKNGQGSGQDSLSITAKGLEIKAQKDADDNVLDSIAAFGTLKIENKANDTLIGGGIRNESGNIEINHLSGGNFDIAGNINAENGSVTINSTSSEQSNGNMTIAGNIAAATGIAITQKNAGDMTISGGITGTDGDITIDRKNAGSLAISGDTTAENGKVTIATINEVLNEDADMTISGAVSANVDVTISQENAGNAAILGAISAATNVAITQENAGDMEISSSITSADGDITIERNNTGSLVILGDTTAEAGKVTIKTINEALNEAADMTIAGAVNARSDLAITQKNAGDLAIAGNITGSGAITVTQENAGNAAISGAISAAAASVSVTQKNADDMEISGGITSADGDITVERNNAGSLAISGDTTAENGKVSISSINDTLNADANMEITGAVNARDEVEIIQKNADDIAISGDITTESGSVTISSTNTEQGDGNMTIAGAVTGGSTGDIEITHKNAGDMEISGGITGSNGDITITQENAGDLAINSKISESGGAVAISNVNGGNLAVSEIYVTGGNIEIKNEDSGTLTINSKIDGDSEQSKYPDDDRGIFVTNKNSGDLTIAESAEIRNRDGNVTISNSGSSDIYQNGGVYADSPSATDNKISDGSYTEQTAYGKATILNNGGSTYLNAPVLSAGNFEWANNSDGGLVINNIIGTTRGEVIIWNLEGDFVLEENASILNLSSYDENRSSGISIRNGTVFTPLENSRMILKGSIVNAGGGDITISNYGKEGSIIAGSIENTIGDIYIENQYKDLSLDGTINALAGKVSINQRGGNIVNGTYSSAYKQLISSSENLTLNVENGDIGSSGSAINVNVGGSIDELYTNNAYITTSGSNLKIQDAHIANRAEITSRGRLAVAEKTFTGLSSDTDAHLYTANMDSLSLAFDNSKLKTNAIVVYNNPAMIVNEYSSEGNFVTKGQKETKVLYESVKALENSSENTYGVVPDYKDFSTVRFDVTDGMALSPEYMIYDISRDGISVKNDKNLKQGDVTTIILGDGNISVNAKVVKVEGDKASLEFVDVTEEESEMILQMCSSLIQENK